MTREILHRLGMPTIGSTVAIQGVGNVGGTAAKLLENEGCKIIALSDSSGAVYRSTGLNVDEVLDFHAQGKPLRDYNAPEVQHITNDELLTVECDVLIPSALESVITEQNASDIRARVIVEGANGPTTLEADKILERKNKVVVPDILANAGGVVVSYFEWVQNIQSLMWDEEEVNRTLEKIMIRAFNEVWEQKNAQNTTMRMGAYIVALNRMVKAKNIRGIFP